MAPLRCTAAACLALLALVAAACSSGGSGTGGSGTGGSGTDQTTATGGSGLIVQVASFDVAVGPPSRLIVGVQGTDRRLVAFGTVDLRFAYLGTRDAPATARDYGAVEEAAFLPIPGTSVPDGEAEPRLVTPSEARGVYAATLGFDRAGFWEVEASVEVDGATSAGTAAFEVLDEGVVPGPGDPAPRTDNLTLDAADDVPRAAIDSRAGRDGSEPIPDEELHVSTVKEILDAGRPAVVVVSTPVYCTSQFCGPITDMVQELSHEYGDRASFVHLEVFRNHDENVVNEGAADWVFPTREGGFNEPWVFVVGGDGLITHRFDNVATRGELEPILEALPVIGEPA